MDFDYVVIEFLFKFNLENMSGHYSSNEKPKKSKDTIPQDEYKDQSHLRMSNEGESISNLDNEKNPNSSKPLNQAYSNKNYDDTDK